MTPFLGCIGILCFLPVGYIITQLIFSVRYGQKLDQKWREKSFLRTKYFLVEKIFDRKIFDQKNFAPFFSTKNIFLRKTDFFGQNIICSCFWSKKTQKNSQKKHEFSCRIINDISKPNDL